MSPTHEKIEKEISWLSFNERVLQEAMDKHVPLIERLRFLGIFSNNMDEFFRVRVADVNRRIIIARAKVDADLTVKHEKKLLRDIQSKVQALQTQFDETYTQILGQLAQRNILLLDETQLTEEQGGWVQEYFRDQVKPVLSTWLLDQKEELSQLQEKLIYLAVDLVLENDTQLYSLIAVPTEKLGRFIPIPRRYSKGKKTFVILDDIIRYCLRDVYSEVMNVSKVEAYTIKLTRDAELERGEEITQGLLDQLSSSLKKRLVAAPVRFVYDREMPEQMLKFLVRKLGMSSGESQTPGGRYHNFKDFMGFPAVGRGKMVYESHQPLSSPQFERHRNLFKAIREQDILLYYP